MRDISSQGVLSQSDSILGRSMHILHNFITAYGCNCEDNTDSGTTPEPDTSTRLIQK